MFVLWLIPDVANVQVDDPNLVPVDTAAPVGSRLANVQTQKANQEDVSAWMTGIVEVPLSVTQRLKNVEETEEAKRKLLAQSGDTLTG